MLSVIGCSQDLDEEETTGHKTTVRRRLDPEGDSHSLDSDENQDYEPSHSQQVAKGGRLPANMTPSSTGDSLSDGHIKGQGH